VVANRAVTKPRTWRRAVAHCANESSPALATAKLMSIPLDDPIGDRRSGHYFETREVGENVAMTSPLSAARAFVEEHYPDAVMAFLGGSAATGTATATSDLDVLILLRDDFGDVAFVETTTHQGWLVEAFVYGPVAAEHWIRRGREERRPVLDTLAASGLVLTGNAQARDWAEHARRVLAVGPGAPEPADVDRRRYGLSSLVDDLEGSGDPAESYVIAATAWREAAELALLATDRWLATGKWLIRSSVTGMITD